MRRLWSHPLAWVLLVAILWRTLFWLSFPLMASNDSDGYYELALDVLAFRWETWFHPVRTPIYPFFLGLLLQLPGWQPDLIILGQTGLGLLSVVIYFYLGELLVNRAGAVLSGLYVGLSPAFLVFEHMLLTETLGLMLQGAILLAAVVAFRAGSRRAALATGVLGVIAALCRPSLLIILGGVGVFGALLCVVRWVGRNRAGAWTAFQTTVLTALTAGALLAPWFWQSYSAYGQFGLVALTNIGRMVFAIRSGFLPLDSPELLAVVPDLPERCPVMGEECGWLPDRALREQGRDQIEREEWAREVMEAHVRADPGRYLAVMGQVALQQMGFLPGRIDDVQYFTIWVVEVPESYLALLSQSSQEFRPASFAQPERIGPGRFPVVWANRYLWRFSWPVVPILFWLGLPWIWRRPGLLLVALVALVSMGSLAALLAPVERYMLLIMPLLWLVALGGGAELAALLRASTVMMRRRVSGTPAE